MSDKWPPRKHNVLNVAAFADEKLHAARSHAAVRRATPRIFASAVYIYMYTCVRVAIYVHIRSVKIIFYFEIARPGSNPSIMSHAMNIIAMQKHRAETAHLSLSLSLLYSLNSRNPFEITLPALRVNPIGR